MNALELNSNTVDPAFSPTATFTTIEDLLKAIAHARDSGFYYLFVKGITAEARLHLAQDLFYMVESDGNGNANVQWKGYERWLGYTEEGGKPKFAITDKWQSVNDLEATYPGLHCLRLFKF